MSTRPIALFATAALALAVMGVYGCGDSDAPDDDKSSTAATATSEGSTSKQTRSETSTTDAPKSGTSTKPGVTFAQRSATGESAIAQAQGIIDNPEIIRLRVVAEPPQQANVSYTLICVVRGKARGDSGQFSAKTPIDREIEIPGGTPTDCNVSANAQLESRRSGKVTMKLRGRER